MIPFNAEIQNMSSRDCAPSLKLNMVNMVNIYFIFFKYSFTYFQKRMIKNKTIVCIFFQISVSFMILRRAFAKAKLCRWQANRRCYQKQNNCKSKQKLKSVKKKASSEQIKSHSESNTLLSKSQITHAYWVVVGRGLMGL